MYILGIIILIAALIALVFYLITSYQTQGGGIGQDPVFGASITQIPLLIMLGIKLIDESAKLNLLWWHYPVIWLALVVSIGCLITLAGHCAKSNNS